MQIIPSVLTNSKEEYSILMERVEGAERVHVDFIDGKFADNTTITVGDVDVLEYPDLLFDAHLMVDKTNLDIWLTEAINAGFHRIITQIESIDEIDEYITHLHDNEVQVGISIDLETEIPHEDYFHGVDVVLVMSVKAGFGDQEFDKRALEKINELSKMRDAGALEFTICVDGGVSSENIKALVEAGADEVTIGRRLFKDDMQDNIERLEGIIANG